MLRQKNKHLNHEASIPSDQFENTDTSYCVKADLNTFIFQLNMRFPTLIINTVDYDKDILLNLRPKDPSNLTSWSEALNEYGLELIPGESEQTFLVLKPMF